jgi:hypothetical protein
MGAFEVLNLPLNSGFNAYTGASKIPIHWTAANLAVTDGKDTTPANTKEGTASIKIQGAAGKTKTLTQTITRSGSSGDKFTFAYWAKGASIPVGGLCEGQVFFYSGTTLKLTKTVPCANGTYTTFQRKSVTFSTTSAYTKAVIVFTYGKASGTVWFDAVSLMKY